MKWIKNLGPYFYAMIAEINLVVINIIDIFFISRNLGSEGAAAFEIVFPLPMVFTAVIALCFNGVQAVCAKDYGAGDPSAFDRHKNAGYTWSLLAIGMMMVVMLALKDPMLDLFGANDGSVMFARYSRECYIVFCIFFLPDSIFSIACSLMYFEEKRKLLAANLIFILGTILGSLFVSVTGPGMGNYILSNVAGAAAADAYIIIECFIRGRTSSLSAWTEIRIPFSDFRQSFFTGLPDFIEYVSSAIRYLIENVYILSRFTASFLAGMSVFEAIDNLPEILCVGFGFLVTAALGTRVGRLVAAQSPQEIEDARDDLTAAAKKISLGGATGGLIVCLLLLILGRPIVGLFVTSADPAAVNSAVMMTSATALSFVFYLLNTELVCYYKIVGAYIPAHIFFFAEANVLPLFFELFLGQAFGVAGYCYGSAVGEFAALFLNLIIVRILSGRFPKTVADFRLDRYIARLGEHKVSA